MVRNQWHVVLEIKTNRKNGAGVNTSVWFVKNGGALFVRTDSAFGKVKHIRNNPRIHIAACKMNGVLLSNRIEASVRVVSDWEMD